MTPHTSLAVGILVGLFIASVVLLTTLMHYITQDMDAFRGWLDKKEM